MTTEWTLVSTKSKRGLSRAQRLLNKVTEYILHPLEQDRNANHEYAYTPSIGSLTNQYSYADCQSILNRLIRSFPDYYIDLLEPVLKDDSSVKANFNVYCRETGEKKYIIHVYSY